MPKWTEDQQRAIQWTNGSLLVSAAAGSGKTSVLAERCGWLVCDAPDSHRCNVNELLVVTFTREAAAEIRHRIEQVLQARLEQVQADPAADPATERRLHDQLLLIQQAAIGTLHGFCATLIRQNFSQLGLDPSVRQLDDNEAALLRRECARQLVAERFENDPDGRFARFVTEYGKDNDENVVQLLLRLHATLASLVDPGKWKSDAISRLQEASRNRSSESQLGKALIKVIRAELQDILEEGKVIAAMAAQAAAEEVRQYGPYMIQCVQLGEELANTLEKSGIDGLRRVNQLKFPRAPSIPEGVPGKEELKKRVDAWKKRLREDFLQDYAAFSEDQLQAQLRGTIESAELLLDLVGQFEERYAQAKKSQRAIDFNDLERYALRLLRSDDGSPTELACTLQRRFRHVLVDEYQDINEVQDEILRLVSTESTADSPRDGNLFCVGDVKQSIYRFRLADPGRFLARSEKLHDPANPAGSHVVALKQNFRSRGPLLDCINAFFERLMSVETADINYDDSHRLNVGATYPEPGGNGFAGKPIEVFILPRLADGDPHDAQNGNQQGNDASREDDAQGDDQSADAGEPDRGSEAGELKKIEREAAVVAKQILGLVNGPNGRNVAEYKKDGGWTSRPLRYSDIAVLLRSTKVKAVQFAEQLRSAGVPVFADRRTGFFRALEVRDVMSLLEVLVNEHQDVPLAAVLRSPLLRMELPADMTVDDVLAEARLAFPASTGTSFAMAVHRFATEKTGTAAKALSSAMKTIARWRELAFTRPVADLLDSIFEETGYLAFVAGLHDGDQRVANLLSLHDRARQFASFQRQSLQRFIDFLRDLRDHEDLGEPSTASTAEAVRVMSIHQSKGLEFPVVFIADLDKAHNEQDLRQLVLIDRDLGLALDTIDAQRHLHIRTLAGRVVEHWQRRQMLAEEMRVLYVAMTRAKEALFLVCEPKKLDLEFESRRWKDHAGPVPPARVLAATSFLDWIVPVSIMVKEERLRIINLAAKDTLDAIELVRKGMNRPGHLEKFATWQPLNGVVADVQRAEEVFADLLYTYPKSNLVELPAATSVSALTKHRQAAPAAKDRSFDRPLDFARLLELPRSISNHDPTATEKGTATHLALQHLDFAAPLDPQGIKTQIGQLVKRRLLTREQANAVDVDAIAWFVSTELGQLLTANVASLQREVAILFPEPGPADDPLDRVMIRGRIDAMLRVSDELVLLDYKTDKVEGRGLEERAEFYMPQLRTYRDAVARFSGLEVRSAHLVFLHAREVVAVR